MVNMRLSTLLCTVLQGLTLTSATPPPNPRAEQSTATATSSKQWPYAPFSTKGRDIVNSRGDVVTWAGINWPMSGETMIPEGLEWKSAADILDDVASVGFNFIRMGYAIQMVDEIYDRDGHDVPMIDALTAALGSANGTRVAKAIVEKNPSWTVKTTRFEIWSG
ncbi:hypothetical protein NPX13_g9387 [Xylaria arbuscula]|uniref:Glycoside hydrolase family 5 domain-containing protein n=1 Tax=Xylaria arbuscula TaxID=114810 RepID=A0A9W8N6N7_9PEZI|nr:hypothetical protein NPX13_g9387 [Xylaria arbuscula]